MQRPRDLGTKAVIAAGGCGRAALISARAAPAHLHTALLSSAPPHGLLLQMLPQCLQTAQLCPAPHLLHSPCGIQARSGSLAWQDPSTAFWAALAQLVMMALAQLLFKLFSCSSPRWCSAWEHHPQEMPFPCLCLLIPFCFSLSCPAFPCASG